MASFVYPYGCQYLLENAWDTIDVRLIWVTASTTADTEFAIQYVGGLATLSEYDGSGYPTTFGTRYEIGTETFSLDLVDRDVKLTTSTGILNKSTIGATPGSEPQVTGFVVCKQGTSDADSPLLAYLDLSAVGEAFTPTGGAVNVTFDSEGIIKALCPAV